LEALAELSPVDVLAGVEEAVASHLMVERPATAGASRSCTAWSGDAVPSCPRCDDGCTPTSPAALEARPGTAAASPPQGCLSPPPGRTGRGRAGDGRRREEPAPTLRRHAYEERRHYAAALDVAGTGPSVRCRLGLELARSRWRAGETAPHRGLRSRAEAYQADREISPPARCSGDVRTQATSAAAISVRRASHRALRGWTRGPFRPACWRGSAPRLAGAADPRAGDLCDERRDRRCA
jgi:hypothetical protein